MFKRKRLIVAALLAVLIVSFTSFVRQKYVIPIIMYHSINPDTQNNSLLVVTPDNFRRQMRFLKEHHYNVVSLEAAADFIKNKKRPPARAIAITFDDGFKDNYTYVLPILKEYNFPATIFIVVNEVGLPPENRLSWDEIHTMQESGLVTFGSHTVSHPNLKGVTSPEVIKNEIQGSKNILEEKLGRKVETFSYPAGRFTKSARQAVIDAGYKLAVVTSPGKRIPDDDIFLIKRLRISKNCNNLFIFWVETSGYYNLMRESKGQKNGLSSQEDTYI